MWTRILVRDSLQHEFFDLLGNLTVYPPCSLDLPFDGTKMPLALL